MLLLRQGYKTGAVIMTLLLLAGCGKSTIDRKEGTFNPSPTITVTIPPIEEPTFSVPTITVTPHPTRTKSATPKPTPTVTQTPTPGTAAPETVAAFLALLGLDQSFAQYTHQIKGSRGEVVAYQIATNGQTIPEHRVPPGVVLDYTTDGIFTGTNTHDTEWVDSQCGRVFRTQAGSEGGSFTGTIVTYYWTGWASPPAAPNWCD